MDRRTSLKTFILGALGSGALLTGTSACEKSNQQQSVADAGTSNDEGYGRTPAEKERDAKIMAESFFTPAEMATITLLCGLILPADDRSGSAVDAGVPEFIEFMAKDAPQLQIPLRGGLMWLHYESNRRFERDFTEIETAQRTTLLDDIAYPTELEQNPDHPMAAGIRFFNLMRDLTLTGFYTSQEGVLKDLQYRGNVANVWDGVPEEVLREHNVDYDPDWLAKCIDQERRNEIAQWDENGNLL